MAGCDAKADGEWSRTLDVSASFISNSINNENQHERKDNFDEQPLDLRDAIPKVRDPQIPFLLVGRQYLPWKAKITKAELTADA